MLLLYLSNVIMQLARIPAGFLQIMRADLLTTSRPAGVPGVGTCFFCARPGCIRDYKAHFERPRGLFTGFLYHKGILYRPRKIGALNAPQRPTAKSINFLRSMSEF